jgi:hypothetical protein
MKRQAVESALKAREVEKNHPIPNFGQIMERIQGPSRVWLEDMRATGVSD